MQPEIRNFLNTASRSANAVQAAVADNCRFDERASSERWQAFTARLPDAAALDWADWSEANATHYTEYVTVPSISVADAFLPINQPAWLQGIVTNRSVVRLEDLRRVLTKTNLTFDQLNHCLTQPNPERDNRLNQFFNAWNDLRDARPLFAAFYDEVKTEADDDDWAHRLRDRLGLGHYNPQKPGDIPVALMRYSLDEVTKQTASKHIPCAFASPTTLDGGMTEFFFPVPKSHPYGATLHLAPEQADTLTAEILHYRFNYERKHLWKIGWITQAHAVEDQRLRAARDLHLLALRTATGRDDFGEMMEGR